MQFSILRGLLLAGVLGLTVSPTMAQQTYPDYLEEDRNRNHFGIESKALWAREEVRLRPGFRLVDATYNETRIGIDPTIVDETDEDYTPSEYEGLDYTPMNWQLNPNLSDFNGVISANITGGSGGVPEITIPIEVFPGAHGMEPNLVISYNPSAISASSVLGHGMSISGTSIISKRAKSRFYEDEVGFDIASNAYWSLNGSILIPISSSSPTERMYRVPHDNSLRVKSNLDNNSNIESFEVIYSDGTVEVFDLKTLHEPSGTTLSYYRTKRIDKFGNLMTYEYVQDDLGKDMYLKRIAYNGNENGTNLETEVLFQYDVKEPRSYTYLKGEEHSFGFKLNSVTVKNRKSTITEYNFEFYQESGTDKIFLTRIRKKSPSGKPYPPLEIQWNLAGPNVIQKIPDSELPGFSSTTPNSFLPLPARSTPGFSEILAIPNIDAGKNATDDHYAVLTTGNIEGFKRESRNRTDGVFLESRQHYKQPFFGPRQLQYTSTYGLSTNFMDLDDDGLMEVFYMTPTSQGKSLILKHAELNEDGVIEKKSGQEEEITIFQLGDDVTDNSLVVPVGMYDLDKNGGNDMIYYYKYCPFSDQTPGSLQLFVIFDDGDTKRYNITSEVYKIPRGSTYNKSKNKETISFTFIEDFDTNGKPECVIYSSHEESIIHLEYDIEQDEFLMKESDLTNDTFKNDFGFDRLDVGNPLELHQVDINIDGNMDLLAQTDRGPLVLLSKGDGSFHKVTDGRYQRLLDFLDSSLPNQRMPCLSGSLGNLSGVTKISGSSFYSGDFNGDNIVDIAAIQFNQSSIGFGILKVFYNNGTTFYDEEVVQYFNGSPLMDNQHCCEGYSNIAQIIVSPSDINSDGRTDLITQRVTFTGECTGQKLYVDDLSVYTSAYLFNPRSLENNDDFAKAGSIHRINNSQNLHEFEYTTPERYGADYDINGNIPPELGGGGEEPEDEIDYDNPTTLPYGYDLFNTNRFFETRVDKGIVLSKIKTYLYKKNQAGVVVNSSFFKYFNPVVHKQLGFLGYGNIHKWSSLPDADGTYNFSFDIVESKHYVSSSRKMVTLKPLYVKNGFGNKLFDYHDDIATVKSQQEFEYRFQTSGPWYNTMPSYEAVNTYNFFEDGSISGVFNVTAWENGNILREISRRNGTEDSKRFLSFFQPEYWDEGLLPQKSIAYEGCIKGPLQQSCSSAQDESTVETTFEYNNFGVITRLHENSNLLTNYQKITNYTQFDPYGNVTAFDVTVNGITKYMQRTYDPTGKYLISETDPNGKTTSYQYDYVFGNKTASVSPTGLATRYIYNADGIRSGKESPKGNNSTRTYEYVNSASTDAIFQKLSNEYDVLIKSTIQADGVLDRVSYSNKWGNPVVAVTTDPYTQQEKYVRHFYDEFERKIATSFPTYDIDDIIDSDHWSTRISSFDYQGRVTERKNKNRDGEEETQLQETISYEEIAQQYKTTVSKGNGKYKTEWKNILGNVVKVEDNGGTVHTHYSKRELPNQMGPDDNSMIEVSYDPLGNRSTMDDPNFGLISYTYDADGKLLEQIKQNAAVTNEYDVLDRITKSEDLENSAETYNYEYYENGHEQGLLEEVTKPEIDRVNYEYTNYRELNKATRQIEDKTFELSKEYDNHGRCISETFESGVQLSYDYNTSSGKLDAIRYGNVVLWEPVSTNIYGQITEVRLANGNLVHEYSFDKLGMPDQKTLRKGEAVLSNWKYTFDDATGNLLEREDMLRRHDNYKETFSYDDLDRLTTVFSNVDHETPVLVMEYDENGNVTRKSDVSEASYSYDPEDRPNALRSIKNVNPELGYQTHNIDFNAIDQPISISAGNNAVSLLYGVEKQRVKMQPTGNSTFTESNNEIREKYYVGSEEWLYTQDNQTIVNHYVNAGGQLIAIIQKNLSTAEETVYYPVTDYLGSILMLVDEHGELYDERSYDAWGRPRDPANWQNYANIAFNVTNRGYTGHEHLLEMGLVNMNGRLYDPIIGRMLSPDNHVPNADNTQSYNRYSYVFNNPLKYKDPDGELPFIAAVLIGATTNVLFNGISNSVGSNKQPFFKGAGKAAIKGAVHGALAFGVGSALGGKFLAAALAHGHINGTLAVLENGRGYGQAFASASISSLASSGVGSIMANSKQVWKVGATILTGGTTGGLGAEIAGGNFWEGFRDGLIVAGLNHAMHMGANMIQESAQKPSSNGLKQYYESYGKRGFELAGHTEAAIHIRMQLMAFNRSKIPVHLRYTATPGYYLKMSNMKITNTILSRIGNVGAVVGAGYNFYQMSTGKTSTARGIYNTIAIGTSFAAGYYGSPVAGVATGLVFDVAAAVYDATYDFFRSQSDYLLGTGATWSLFGWEGVLGTDNKR